MLIEIVRLEDDNDDKNATGLYRRRAHSHVMPFQHVKRSIELFLELSPSSLLTGALPPSNGLTLQCCLCITSVGTSEPDSGNDCIKTGYDSLLAYSDSRLLTAPTSGM